jgi:hypothetical protein
MAFGKWLPLLFGSIVFFVLSAEPAAAETIRVPLPIWILLELWNLIWSFWGLIAFVAFVPLKKIVLGAVLTVGGAFLPDLPVKQGAKQKPETGGVNITLPGQARVSFKGAPRYAVLAVGLIIVLSSLWDGYAAAH